ncbi:uncharacterized protein LOC135927836 isoform X2 [Gordionus sp. m RMFG-2023]|uniref:uncharacterized protein LOC135927836 isoform X2 n=1 Tax=Gordionus sp. m RMFG-2023 TaxID=3053472 RepID=UPI0031FCCE76
MESIKAILENMKANMIEKEANESLLNQSLSAFNTWLSLLTAQNYFRTISKTGKNMEDNQIPKLAIDFSHWCKIIDFVTKFVETQVALSIPKTINSPGILNTRVKYLEILNNSLDGMIYASDSLNSQNTFHKMSLDTLKRIETAIKTLNTKISTTQTISNLSLLHQTLIDNSILKISHLLTSTKIQIIDYDKESSPYKTVANLLAKDKEAFLKGNSHLFYPVEGSSSHSSIFNNENFNLIVQLVQHCHMLCSKRLKDYSVLNLYTKALVSIACSSPFHKSRMMSLESMIQLSDSFHESINFRLRFLADLLGYLGHFPDKDNFKGRPNYLINCFKNLIASNTKSASLSDSDMSDMLTKTIYISSHPILSNPKSNYLMKAYLKYHHIRFDSHQIITNQSLENVIDDVFFRIENPDKFRNGLNLTPDWQNNLIAICVTCFPSQIALSFFVPKILSILNKDKWFSVDAKDLTIHRTSQETLYNRELYTEILESIQTSKFGLTKSSLPKIQAIKNPAERSEMLEKWEEYQTLLKEPKIFVSLSSAEAHVHTVNLIPKLDKLLDSKHKKLLIEEHEKEYHIRDRVRKEMLEAGHLRRILMVLFDVLVKPEPPISHAKLVNFSNNSIRIMKETFYPYLDEILATLARHREAQSITKIDKVNEKIKTNVERKGVTTDLDHMILNDSGAMFLHYVPEILNKLKALVFPGYPELEKIGDLILKIMNRPQKTDVTYSDEVINALSSIINHLSDYVKKLPADSNNQSQKLNAAVTFILPLFHSTSPSVMSELNDSAFSQIDIASRDKMLEFLAYFFAKEYYDPCILKRLRIYEFMIDTLGSSASLSDQTCPSMSKCAALIDSMCAYNLKTLSDDGHKGFATSLEDNAKQNQLVSDILFVSRFFLNEMFEIRHCSLTILNSYLSTKPNVGVANVDNKSYDRIEIEWLIHILTQHQKTRLYCQLWILNFDRHPECSHLAKKILYDYLDFRSCSPKIKDLKFLDLLFEITLENLHSLYIQEICANAIANYLCNIGQPNDTVTTDGVKKDAIERNTNLGNLDLEVVCSFLDKLMAIYIDNYKKYLKEIEIKIRMNKYASQANMDDTWNIRYSIVLIINNIIKVVSNLCPLRSVGASKIEILFKIYEFMVGSPLKDENIYVKRLALNGCIDLIEFNSPPPLIGGIKNANGDVEDFKIGAFMEIRPLFDRTLQLTENHLSELPNSASFDALRQTLIFLLSIQSNQLLFDQGYDIANDDFRRYLKIFNTLVEALKTPSQNVQERAAECMSQMISNVINKKLTSDVNIEVFRKLVLGKFKEFEKILLATEDDNKPSANDLKTGTSISLATRKGSAYGMSAIFKGAEDFSLAVLDTSCDRSEDLELVNYSTSALKACTEKKGARKREGCLFLLQSTISILHESHPSIMNKIISAILPILLIESFGEISHYVRLAAFECFDVLTRRVNVTALTNQVLPTLVQALASPAWRTQIAAIQMLSSTVISTPTNSASQETENMESWNTGETSNLLPMVMSELVEKLCDSHEKIREESKKAIRKIAVHSNADIQQDKIPKDQAAQEGEEVTSKTKEKLVDDLIDAMSRPDVKMFSCLIGLIESKIFTRPLDSGCLALLMPVLKRAIADRASEMRRVALKVLTRVLEITNEKEIRPYLKDTIKSLKLTLIDPLPEVRNQASQALSNLIGILIDAAKNEKKDKNQALIKSKNMGGKEEETTAKSLQKELLDWLMKTLVSEVSSVNRSGAAQGLSVVIHQLGLVKLNALSNDIISTLKNKSLPAHVKDGYLMLFLYLPTTFGDAFVPYIDRIVPPLLMGLSDESEYVRETAIKAGKGIINTYSIEVISTSFLPQIQNGILNAPHTGEISGEIEEKFVETSSNWRIRYSCVQLIGELVFKILGITGKMTTFSADSDDTFASENTYEILSETLGEDRFQSILAGLYLCANDNRQEIASYSLHIWKIAVHNTVRVLKHLVSKIVPAILDHLTRAVITGDNEAITMSGNTLGTIVRKLEGILPELLGILKSHFDASTAKNSRYRDDSQTAIIDDLYQDDVKGGKDKIRNGLDKDDEWESVESEEESSDSKNCDYARRGVCLALKYVMQYSSRDIIMLYCHPIDQIIITCLKDPDEELRSVALKLFDKYHQLGGQKVLDNIIPALIKELDKFETHENDDSYVLEGLKEMMDIKSRALLPYIIPKLESNDHKFGKNTHYLYQLISFSSEGTLDRYSEQILKKILRALINLAPNLDFSGFLAGKYGKMDEDDEEEETESIDQGSGKNISGEHTKKVGESIAEEGILKERMISEMLVTFREILSLFESQNSLNYLFEKIIFPALKSVDLSSPYMLSQQSSIDNDTRKDVKIDAKSPNHDLEIKKSFENDNALAGLLILHLFLEGAENDESGSDQEDENAEQNSASSFMDPSLYGFRLNTFKNILQLYKCFDGRIVQMATALLDMIFKNLKANEDSSQGALQSKSNPSKNINPSKSDSESNSEAEEAGAGDYDSDDGTESEIDHRDIVTQDQVNEAFRELLVACKNFFRSFVSANFSTFNHNNYTYLGSEFRYEIPSMPGLNVAYNQTFNRNNPISPFLYLTVEKGILCKECSDIAYKEVACQALAELVKIAPSNVLEPIVLKIMGPILRLLTQRYDLGFKSQLMSVCSLLLFKNNSSLKFFAPQLQATFLKVLKESSVFNMSDNEHKSSISDDEFNLKIQAARGLSHLMPVHSKPFNVTNEIFKALNKETDKSNNIIINGIDEMNEDETGSNDHVTPEYRIIQEKKILLYALRVILSGCCSNPSFIANIHESETILNLKGLIETVTNIEQKSLETECGEWLRQDDENVRLLFGCVGAMAAFISAKDFVKICEDYVLNEEIIKNQNLDLISWDTTLYVMAKKCPNRLISFKNLPNFQLWNRLLDTISYYIQPENKINYGLSAVRCLAYLIMFRLVSGLFKDSKSSSQESLMEPEILELFFKTILHKSLEVKNFVVNVIHYLDQTFKNISVNLNVNHLAIITENNANQFSQTCLNILLKACNDGNSTLRNQAENVAIKFLGLPDGYSLERLQTIYNTGSNPNENAKSMDDCKILIEKTLLKKISNKKNVQIKFIVKSNPDFLPDECRNH